MLNDLLPLVLFLWLRVAARLRHDVVGMLGQQLGETTRAPIDLEPKLPSGTGLVAKRRGGLRKPVRRCGFGGLEWRGAFGGPSHASRGAGLVPPKHH
jgi:hypothetical protein